MTEGGIAPPIGGRGFRPGPAGLPTGQHDLVAAFPATPPSVPAARVWVCLQLADHLPLHDWGMVALLVGELATNAVMHAATDDFTVRLDFRDGVEASVHDDDATAPRAHPAPCGNGSGRGLALVEAIADSWGTRIDDGGKWVWFRVDEP